MGSDAEAAAHGTEKARPAVDVLLVEDNRDVRNSAKIVLELLGHRVEVASNGLEGLEKGLALHPRVAMVDIGLPGLDGYAVARRLRAALGGEIVLVAYTAYGDPEARTRAAEAGYELHLVKPIDWELFAPWLARAVARVEP